jgi:hypothetical protein
MENVIVEESLGGGGCSRVGGVDLAEFSGPPAGLAAGGRWEAKLREDPDLAFFKPPKGWMKNIAV